MRFTTLLLAFVVTLFFSCKESKSRVYIQELHVVQGVWKETPLNVHQEVSPSFRAAISNGDTIVVSSFVEVGDTVIILTDVSE